MKRLPPDPIVCFGLFEADLRSAELRKNGHKVKLQEQPFQLLAMLLERPGQVISREELRTRLWPADTFVDFDHGLNAAVKRLRDALGDSAENPIFVETLSRRGYRFIAPVNVPPNSLDPQKESLPRHPTRNRWRIALAVLAVLLIDNSVGWVTARHFNRKAPAGELRLTANPPDDPILNAVISPDAKYLAFADRSGIFLRVLATGETHSVALPEGFKPQPTGWFPDGSHLLVTKSVGPQGAASVWSVSVFGGAPRKLMDNAAARSVSPDGSQIAFVTGEALHQEIWLMSANGEHPRKAFGDFGDVFGSVAWSPDGRLLAFVRFKYGWGYKDDQASLWIVKPGGAPSSVVLSDARLGEALAWAPDERLVYSLSEPPPNQSDSNLWAIGIDSENARAIGRSVRLTSGPDKKVRLSLSADGKRLTFLRWRGEPHVYVAEVQDSSNRLSLARALSLDEGRNFPSAWTPDGKSVFFTSDRDGPFHLFKQSPDQPAPDLVVGGTDSVRLARLNPDGSQLLYLLAPARGDNSGLARLMRIPISGGTPQLLLEEPEIDNFQCARLPSTTCIFGRSIGAAVAFFGFDAVTGREEPLAAIKPRARPDFNWSLSPDGLTLALGQWRRGQIPAEIELLSVHGGASRSLSLEGWSGISSIDWAADGRSLWVSAINPVGTHSLLNVDLHGRAKPLLQGMQREVGWAIPSPDGRHIALWQGGGSSNAWLLQGF